MLGGSVVSLGSCVPVCISPSRTMGSDIACLERKPQGRCLRHQRGCACALSARSHVSCHASSSTTCGSAVGDHNTEGDLVRLAIGQHEGGRASNPKARIVERVVTEEERGRGQAVQAADDGHLCQIFRADRQASSAGEEHSHDCTYTDGSGCSAQYLRCYAQRQCQRQQR